MAKIPTPGSPEEADAARARLARYRDKLPLDDVVAAADRSLAAPDPVKLEQTRKDAALYSGNLNQEPTPAPTKPTPKVRTATPATRTAAPTGVAPTGVAPAPKPRPKPKADPLAEVRADLLANAQADAAAKARAEQKRKESEAFSTKLKGATKRGGASRTGYDAYKNLMGE